MAAFCYCLRTPYNHVRVFLSRGWSGVWKELRFAASLEMSLSFSTSFSEPQPLEWNREDEVSPQACSEDVLSMYMMCNTVPGTHVLSEAER